MISEDFSKIIDHYKEIAENPVDIPREVGPETWKYLHKFAKYVLPDAQSQLNGFDTLKQVISTFPCHECSEHGMQYLSSHPFNPDAESLEEYVCKFHNVVNEHLNKPVKNCYDLEQIEVTTRDVVSIHSEDNDEIHDTDIEIDAVPYASQDVSISIPIGPAPGAPSIGFSLGSDWPFTIFPISRRVLDRAGRAPPLRKEFFDRFNEELQKNREK